MSLSDVQLLVDDLVRDVGERVSPSQRDRAIAVAVTRLSVDRPRVVAEDVVSAGGQALPTPTLWQDGRSTVQALEHPVGNVPPARWPLDEVSIYLAPAGEEIHLTRSLLSGDVVRVSYGLPHVLDATTDTIPAAHIEAVGYYAAAHLCDQLASQYADNTEPTIGADRVDQGAQARAWRALAKDYRARYGEIVGLPSGDGGGNYVPPAATVLNHDMQASDGRRPLWRRR